MFRVCRWRNVQTATLGGLGIRYRSSNIPDSSQAVPGFIPEQLVGKSQSQQTFAFSSSSSPSSSSSKNPSDDYNARIMITPQTNGMDILAKAMHHEVFKREANCDHMVAARKWLHEQSRNSQNLQYTYNLLKKPKNVFGTGGGLKSLAKLSSSSLKPSFSSSTEVGDGIIGDLEVEVGEEEEYDEEEGEADGQALAQAQVQGNVDNIQFDQEPYLCTLPQNSSMIPSNPLSKDGNGNNDSITFVVKLPLPLFELFPEGRPAPDDLKRKILRDPAVIQRVQKVMDGLANGQRFDLINFTYDDILSGLRQRILNNQIGDASALDEDDDDDDDDGIGGFRFRPSHRLSYFESRRRWSGSAAARARKSGTAAEMPKLRKRLNRRKLSSKSSGEEKQADNDLHDEKDEENKDKGNNGSR